MKSDALPVLMYHALDTSGRVTATDPGWFAETMARLAEAGFRSIDLEDWIARDRPAVERGFALTFDDGLKSVEAALETVQRHGLKPTVFLVTDRVGLTTTWESGVSRRSKPLLRWSDLDYLVTQGFRVGSHTRTHRRLDLCDPQALEAELRGSREEIEQRLGRACPLLAYPYGIAPRSVRSEAMRWYSAAFGTRLAYATHGEDRFDLARIDAYYLRGRKPLAGLVSGRWDGPLRARRMLREARQTGRRLLALSGSATAP